MDENVFDETIFHINRAKELIKQANDTNPQLANMALRGAVSNLLQALEKLCKETLENFAKIERRPRSSISVDKVERMKNEHT